MLGNFLPAGTRVRLDSGEGGPEFGVVVHCWSEDLGDGFLIYDCYVAFFGREFPDGSPEEKPYVLKYASTSLQVLD